MKHTTFVDIFILVLIFTILIGGAFCFDTVLRLENALLKSVDTIHTLEHRMTRFELVNEWLEKAECETYENLPADCEYQVAETFGKGKLLLRQHGKWTGGERFVLQ